MVMHKYLKNEKKKKKNILCLTTHHLKGELE